MAAKSKSKCEWCNGSDNDEPELDNLCRAHLAEYEGLSVSEMDRRDSEQYAEWADATYG